MHSQSTYMFHYFVNPEFNDKNIQLRLNTIRLKINKQQMLKKKIEKDAVTLYSQFKFLSPQLKQDLEEVPEGGEKEQLTAAQKIKQIDSLPREGVIFLEDEMGHFGSKPKMVFWREFRGIIVALIGECDDCNLANQSVFITFLLKEVSRMIDEDNGIKTESDSAKKTKASGGITQKLLQGATSLIPSIMGCSSSSSSEEESDLDESMMNAKMKESQSISDVWTGLPKEEKLLELIEKVGGSAGLLPFYTIDFFKYQVNSSLI